MWLPEQVTFANGEEHVLVGSLDLNQGKVLPGEIVGSNPEVSSDFVAQVCHLMSIRLVHCIALRIMDSCLFKVYCCSMSLSFYVCYQETSLLLWSS